MSGLVPQRPEDALNDFARVAPDGPAKLEDVDVGAFRGFAYGVGMAGMRGFAETGRALNFLAGAVPAAYGALTGKTDAADDYFARMVAPMNDVVDYWTPSARTTGAATNVIAGFFKLGTEAMAGGAVPLIAAEQTGPQIDLVDKGVNVDAAGKLGLVRGATNALGLSFAGFGGTLWQRVLSNFAGNAALSAAATGSEAGLLKEAGRPDLAPDVSVFDPHARSLDLLTGVVMGLTHRGAAPVAAARDADAALAAANANRVQTTTAPARPATAAGQQAHVDAISEAIAAVVRGERVDVASMINPADFRLDQPNPQAATVMDTARQASAVAAATGVRGAIRDAAVTSGVDPHTALAIAAIESRFDPNAKNPVSSASGLFQFLDSTWKAMGGTGENRFDVAMQARLGAELLARNTQDLTTLLGRAPRPEEVYLAHLLGMPTAKRVLAADAGTPMVDAIGTKNAATIVEQNGMKGMTVAEATEHWRSRLDRAATEELPQRAKTTTSTATPIVSRSDTTSTTAPEAGELEFMRQDDTPTARAVNPIDADLQAARETALADPSRRVAIDALDGEPVEMSADEAIAHADQQIADAGQRAGLFETAVNCYLRGGA